MKNIEIEEHLDEVLTKSKSVSFNEVIETRHVVRMIMACILTSFNASFVDKQIPMYSNDQKGGINKAFANDYFFGGLLFMFIGYI